MDTLTRRVSWIRILVEAGIIVGSILAAFGIDAWWDSKADTRQEEALLIALVEDFDAAERGLEEAMIRHEIVVSATERLLQFSDSRSASASDYPLLDTLVSKLFYRPTWDPPMGTVETLLGSGRLDLLSNPELVSELTRWTAMVENFRQRESVAERHFYERVYPFLASHINLKDVDKAIPVEVPWEQRPANAHRLVSEPEFQNIVYMHWVLHWNVQYELPEVEAALSRIGSLTQAELGH